jgi:hypothetical protein
MTKVYIVTHQTENSTDAHDIIVDAYGSMSKAKDRARTIADRNGYKYSDTPVNDAWGDVFGECVRVIGKEVQR